MMLPLRLLHYASYHKLKLHKTDLCGGLGLSKEEPGYFSGGRALIKSVFIICLSEQAP